MRSTKYTREVLEPIVASSTSISDVIRRLGCKPNGGMHRLISARIRQAGLSVEHFRRGEVGAEIAALTREQLVTLAERSSSVAQVLQALSLPEEGRPHRHLSRRLRELGVDTKHFRGRGWARGESAATHSSVARTTRRNTLPDEQVFVENGPTIQGTKLARRLVALGWPYRCAWCGIEEWRGQRLVLHLDHINGINNDHRLENLRLLCPNCHSQTDTYCKRVR